MNELEFIVKKVDTTAKWIQYHKKTPVHFLECGYCSKKYVSSMGWSKYCSEYCRTASKVSVIYLYSCNFCGKAYVARNKNSITCSPECYESVKHSRRNTGVGRILNKRSSNKSGIRGVYWNKSNGRVICNTKGVQIYSGYDFFEACCVRKSVENDLSRIINPGFPYTDAIKNEVKKHLYKIQFLTRLKRDGHIGVRVIKAPKNKIKVGYFFHAEISYKKKIVKLYDGVDLFEAWARRKAAEAYILKHGTLDKFVINKPKTGRLSWNEPLLLSKQDSQGLQ